MSDEQHFVFRLIAPRATFVEDMTDLEAEAMGAHAAYWQELTAAGRVVVYGLVMDSGGPWGLGVVRAESKDEVDEIGREDPAVSSGTCTFDVGVMPLGATLG